MNEAGYTYDNNGNLLNDGTYTYSYDEDNRLTQIVDAVSETTYTYGYNGLGDLLESSIGTETTTYVLGLAGSLSQVLSDGTNTYTYGYNRISQTDADTTGYFLDDDIDNTTVVMRENGVVTWQLTW